MNLDAADIIRRYQAELTAMTQRAILAEAEIAAMQATEKARVSGPSPTGPVMDAPVEPSVVYEPSGAQ